MEFLTAYRKQVAASRRPVPWLNIDMTPLLAVMTVLLFLLMAPMLIPNGSHGSATNRPWAVNAQPLPGAAREDAIVVTVTRDGRIFLPHSEVTLAELPSRIHEAVGKSSSHHVYLSADQRAKYSDVKAVVDKIGDAGIKNVSLLTDSMPPR